MSAESTARPLPQGADPGALCPHRRPGFASPDEFNALVGAEIDRMFRVARSVLRSDDLARDAVQETLIDVWTRGWPAPGRAGALRRLTFLSCLHALRSERRRAFHEERARRRVECDGESPLSALETGELMRTIREELERIPVCYRCVFELFELQGDDYATIAGKLRIPVGTVRSRLSRARSELRARLENRIEGDAASVDPVDERGPARGTGNSPPPAGIDPARPRIGRRAGETIALRPRTAFRAARAAPVRRPGQ